MLKLLMLVDHAVAISGPHRNVVATLNALSARSDINLKLLTGKIDNSEPYSKQCDIILGFEPHKPSKILQNANLLRQATKDRELIYVSSGLKAFLYAYFLKRQCKLLAGPNVTGIPLLMNTSNPSPLMTMHMADAWIEMSSIRIEECVSAGTPREYINYIPHAKNAEYFTPELRDEKIWQEFGIRSDSIKIVHVGRMNEERKGIHELIQAFILLQNECSEYKLDLILICKEGEFFTNEHRRVPNVHSIGPHYGKELVRLIASADIFMGASRYETFWHTPLEAMSCGLPVVVSTAGAVPTMIPEDGVQGRAVSIVDSGHQFLPDAAERLANAAVPLIVDKELRVQMGQRARQHVIANFSETYRGQLLAEVMKKTVQRVPRI